MEGAAVKVSRELQTIADELQTRLNGVAEMPVMFSLFVWTQGRANYIANADRQQIIAVLEELIEKWKSGFPDIPAHEVN